MRKGFLTVYFLIFMVTFYAISIDQNQIILKIKSHDKREEF